MIDVCRQQLLAGESRASAEGTLVLFLSEQLTFMRIKSVKCHGLIKGKDRLLAPHFLCHAERREVNENAVCRLCSCWLFWFEERKTETGAD